MAATWSSPSLPNGPLKVSDQTPQLPSLMAVNYLTSCILDHTLRIDQQKYAAIPCRFYSQGFCAASSACQFSHSQGGERPVCNYFLAGSCRYGDICTLSHQRTRDGPNPPSLPLSEEYMLPSDLLEDLNINSKDDKTEQVEHGVDKQEDGLCEPSVVKKKEIGFGSISFATLTQMSVEKKSSSASSSASPSIHPPPVTKSPISVVASALPKSDQVRTLYLFLSPP